MDILTLILSVLLGLIFLFGGVGLLRDQDPMATTVRGLGVGSSLQRVIGVLKVLGGIGVVAGLLVQPLGIAAAVGIAALMVGAIGFHVKAGDTVKATAGAAVMLVIAATVTTVQLVTA